MKKKVVSLFLMAIGVGCIGMQANAGGNADIQLNVESSLNGSAFTHNKSTLKHHLETNVTYSDDSQAVFALTMADGSEVDDSKIDSSSAKVELVDGEGYYPSEYVFSATQLDGTWEGGQYIYKLSEGDLELNKSVYPLKDVDSGREWSALNGDGAGNYIFNLKVSGIVYNGNEVEDVIFPVSVHVFGFNYTEDAVSLYGEEGTLPIEPVFTELTDKPEVSDTAVFTWVGDGDKPVLCDQKEDDFYISWPEGTDASGLTAQDVKITLTSSASGKTKVLTADQDYYINAGAEETQIALTYINWAFVPVYDTLTIETPNASETFDIASVYVFEAQQGGGGTTVDGTVTAYSFYGLQNLESWDQIMQPAYYLLFAEQEDGSVLYYAETEEGIGYLTDDQAQAYQLDASGENYRNQQLIGNTVYITTNSDMENVDKEVDGETIAFTVYAPGRNDAVSGGGKLKSPAECDQTLKAAPGYAIPWGTENWITNEKWAWQSSVEEGWCGINIAPTTGHGEFKMAVGTQQQFEADAKVEHWEIAGDVAEGTTLSESGLLSIAEDETLPSFAVTAVGADGSVGAMNIKIVDASELEQK